MLSKVGSVWNFYWLIDYLCRRNYSWTYVIISGDILLFLTHSFWVSYSSSPFVTLLLVYYWFVELREESNRLTLFIERDTVWELVEGMLRALYCSYLNAASICHYDCGIRRELEAGVIGIWTHGTHKIQTLKKGCHNYVATLLLLGGINLVTTWIFLCGIVDSYWCNTRST